MSKIVSSIQEKARAWILAALQNLCLNSSEEESEIQSSNTKLQMNFVKAHSWQVCVSACVQFLALELLSVCSYIMYM